MGQQQLLLIVLGVIIVGIAVAIGINMFTSGAAQANLNAVSSDLQTITSNAQLWYRKTAALGGGDRSFENITLPAIGGPTSNANGTYSIIGTPAANTFVVQGVGLEDGDGDGTNVTITVTVYADSFNTTVNNR